MNTIDVKGEWAIPQVKRFLAEGGELPVMLRYSDDSVFRATEFVTLKTDGKEAVYHRDGKATWLMKRPLCNEN